jgi:predicted AlkP superfamily pyrophosphatase or phosphodiesterase
LPEAAREASQVVLLVLDGLGWYQLQERPAMAPVLTAMAGGPITSVVPTTTATALTSIALGSGPAAHGVVGYRLRVPGLSGPEVLNVLRWRTSSGDARPFVPPADFQPTPAFGGRSVPVVTRSEFLSSGFTAAHLGGARHIGWALPSALVVEVGALLRGGEAFVYAYYDGIDKIAHGHGFGPYYDAELVAADRLVGDLIACLPAGAVLVVTADHGQVDVGPRTIEPAATVMALTKSQSGEGRFRWLHAKPGAAADLLAAATDEHGDVAWVVSRTQTIDEGWFGPVVSPPVSARLGDVALVARERISFDDPADGGPFQLVCRHGSLTSAEMLVPLLAAGAD